MRQSLFGIAGGLALAILLHGVGDQLHAQQTAGAQDEPAVSETNGERDEPSTSSDSSRDQGDLRDPSPERVQPSESDVPLPRPDAQVPPARPSAIDSSRNGTDSLRGRTRVQAGGAVDRVQDFNLGIRFGAAGRRGLTVDTIERNSLFFDSGLRRGDVIVSVHGRPIRTEAEFVALVRSQPGVPIPVVVLRDGREAIIYVTYRQEVIQPPPVVVVQQPQVQVVGAPGFLGVMFDTEIPEAAIVRSVFPDSPAARMGLRAGDEIVALNGEAVSTYRSAVEMIDEMDAGEPLVITFTRVVQNQAETVLAPQPGTTVRTALRPVDIRVRPAPAPVVVEQPAEVRVVPALPPATR